MSAGPEAKWPAPAQDSYVDVSLVSALAKAGAVPPKAVDELTAIDDEWKACVQKGWKAIDRKIDGGKMTQADFKDEARKIERGCRKSIDRMETALVTFAEARQKERRELFDKAKARVVSLGANKLASGAGPLPPHHG